MERFHDVANDLIIQSGMGVVAHTGTLGEIVGSYRGGRTLAVDGEFVDFSGTAAKQLFRLVGLDVATLNKFKNHPELQAAMLQAKLSESQRKEDHIVVRGIERGDRGVLYQAFMTEDHLPVMNGQIVNALRNTLPETAEVHKAYVSDCKMSLRIVDENWYHDLGSGGKALTAIVVENDERGGGGLSVRTGVTRVACWNYTLDHQPVFAHNSGFLLPAKLEQGISTAVARLDEVASSVAENLVKFQETSVDDVQGMLKLMAGELDLPNYAAQAAEEWWKDNGSFNSVFWVVQALAFAAGSMTEGKRKQWNRREQVEYQAYHMGNEFTESGTISFHECPKCHRPMNVLDEEDVVEGEYELG